MLPYQPTGWDAGPQIGGWQAGYQPTGWDAGPNAVPTTDTSRSGLPASLPPELHDGAEDITAQMRAQGSNDAEIVAELRRLHEYRLSLLQPPAQAMARRPSPRRIKLPQGLPPALHDGAHETVADMRSKGYTESAIVAELIRLRAYRDSLMYPRGKPPD